MPESLQLYKSLPAWNQDYQNNQPDEKYDKEEKEIIEDRKRITGALYKNRLTMRKLIEEGFKVASKEGAIREKTAILGYCFGGTAVLEYARQGAGLKGYISFHGGLDIPEGQDYSKTKGTVLILHGSADKHVSMDDFAKLATAMEKHKINHEMITYGGAPHAFSVFGSDRYRKDADTRSWLIRRFIQFLGEIFP